MNEATLGEPRKTRRARRRPQSCPWCDLALAATAIFCTINPANVPLWLLAAFPLIGLIRFLMTGHAWRRSPIDWPLTLLCLMSAVSLAITALPDVTHDAFVYFACGVAMLGRIPGWGTSPKRLAWALVALGLAGLALVALSPLGSKTLSLVPNMPSQLRTLLTRLN